MTSPVYALSIRQPWAAMIMSGYKPIENRKRRTNIRETIWIHAGLTWDHTGAQAMREIAHSQGVTDSHINEILLRYGSKGCILGTARIDDCVDDHDSPWFFGPYGYILADPKPIKPIPCKGKLGFFKPDIAESLIKEVAQ